MYIKVKREHIKCVRLLNVGFSGRTFEAVTILYVLFLSCYKQKKADFALLTTKFVTKTHFFTRKGIENPFKKE